MVVFSNKNFKIKSPLSIFILEYGLDPKKTIQLSKKEILAIVLCIQKFQEDVYNKKFLIRVDCKSAKEIL